MTDDNAPRPTEGQNENKTRDILNRSFRRINPTRIEITDNTQGTRGGHGVVVVGILRPRGAAVVPWRPGEPAEKALRAGWKEKRPETLKHLSPEEYMAAIYAAFKNLMFEQKVAIKKLEWPRDDADMSAKFFKSFVNELILMDSISHPNIVEFLGFVEDMEKGDAWIITPWEANGNVREFLQSGKWEVPERISLIQDTARGLEYLHTRDPPICHGDLKSLNILVNSSYRAVITDFGSARIRRRLASENRPETPTQAPVNDDTAVGAASPQVKFNLANLDLTLTGPGFSLRWTAPEVLRDGMQDLPSDMWAIGWICWEIVTGRLPFDELDKETSIIVRTIQGRLPAIRTDTQLSHALMLCSLMSDCWLSDPSQRIDASTFSRKAGFLPSDTPSSYTPEGLKTRSARLLIQLGQWSELQDDIAKAEFHYVSAIETATQANDEATKARALRFLGNVYRVKSDSQKAESMYKRAQDIHSRMGNSRDTAVTLNGLGMVYQEQAKHREAERCFVEAFETFSRLGDDLGTASALDRLGTSYRVQSRYREAEKAVKSAHEIYSRIGDDLGTAYTLLNLGHTHRVQSRYQEAEQAFNAGHEIYSRIGNEIGIANALDGLGKTYRVQYRIEEAEKALTSAYEIHSRIGNDMGSANALTALGYGYCVQSRNREAEKALNAAYEIHSRIGNPLGAADTLVGLGITYRLQSRYQEAEEALNTSQEISSRINDDSGTARALSELGRVYHLQSRNQEAENAFNTAHEIHSRIGDDSGVASALDGLGEVYRAQSRYQEAEKAFTDAYTIHDSLGDHLRAEASLRGLEKLYNDKNDSLHPNLQSI